MNLETLETYAAAAKYTLPAASDEKRRRETITAYSKEHSCSELELRMVVCAAIKETSGVVLSASELDA